MDFTVGKNYNPVPDWYDWYDFGMIFMLLLVNNVVQKMRRRVTIQYLYIN